MGDDCLIENIGRYIAHYDIEDGVLLENVGEVYCEGESAFGNGTAVSVINEGGGREVLIYDELTAQTAYIMAMYRQRTPDDSTNGAFNRPSDRRKELDTRTDRSA